MLTRASQCEVELQLVIGIQLMLWWQLYMRNNPLLPLHDLAQKPPLSDEPPENAHRAWSLGTAEA